MSKFVKIFILLLLFNYVRYRRGEGSFKLLCFLMYREGGVKNHEILLFVINEEH